MDITVRCKCGRELTAPEESIGLNGTCPTCGRRFVIEPIPEGGEGADGVAGAGAATVESPSPPKPQRDPATLPESAPPARASVIRHVLYLLLAAALVPLAWQTFHPDTGTFDDRFER